MARVRFSRKKERKKERKKKERKVEGGGRERERYRSTIKTGNNKNIPKRTVSCCS